MIWQLSHRGDLKSRLISDRHYNRQKPGTAQFVPPGRCAVFYAKTDTGQALWVTSWPFAEYVKHAWAGAWICSAFRNENAGTASRMIIQALSCTRFSMGEPPELGMITFINRKFVKPYITARGKEIFGQTFRQAGFKEVGETKGGLLAFQILPQDMPEGLAPIGSQDRLLIT